MILNEIIKKIPGTSSIPKNQGQGYIDDLSKKEKFELEEILKRQNKILSNKNFLSKLPDKGEKVRNFRDKVLKELEYKNEIEKTANLLSQLNIACKGKAAMTKLEWTGKYDENEDTSQIELDSDDEEDPLKILAQSAGSHKRKIVHIEQKESLITSDDIKEINSFKTDSLNLNHMKYIIDKVEKGQETNKKKESFKPYKTTKSNVHDPMKEKQRKLPENWEVTAATPPLIVHDAAKVLNLCESFKLQQEQNEKRKIMQIKQSIENVTSATNITDYEPKKPGDYRTNFTSYISESEDEMLDEEDYDKEKTVVFSINSTES